MIDLHCHLLPGIDDGAPNLATSLAMARIAIADGIKMVACTPHIYPGLYENTGPAIRQAVVDLQARAGRAGMARATQDIRVAHWLDGGIGAWQAADLPLARGR